MFFSYDPLDCFQRHETAEEAETACRDAVDEHREIAGDEGWSEDAGEVCWGEIRQRLTETSRRPVSDHHCSGFACDEIVEMELLPKLGSDPEPEVDRLVREAEQRGRDAAVEVFARRVPELRNQILADAAREVEAAVAEAEQRGRDAERERCLSKLRDESNVQLELGNTAEVESLCRVMAKIESGEQPGEGGVT